MPTCTITMLLMALSFSFLYSLLLLCKKHIFTVLYNTIGLIICVYQGDDRKQQKNINTGCQIEAI